MKFLVKKQQIDCIERDKLADGQIAFVSFRFVFDNEWEGLYKVVQFMQGENTYNISLGVDGYSCKMPSELQAGCAEMSLFGYAPDDETALRATTAPIKLRIEQSGFSSSGSEVVPPTPDLYQQLIAKIDEKIASVHDGADGASAYEIAVENGYTGTEAEWLSSLKGEKGDTGEQGLQGIQGEKGEKGDTGAAGKDGMNGTDGRDGANGFSPTVIVTETSTGATITATDKNGTTTATVNSTLGERVRLYVDAEAGSDTNNGKTTTTAVQTIDRALVLANAYQQAIICLKKGQTYTATDKSNEYGIGIQLYHRTLRFEAYGTASDLPKIQNAIFAYNCNLEWKAIDLTGNSSVFTMYNTIANFENCSFYWVESRNSFAQVRLCDIQREWVQYGGFSVISNAESQYRHIGGIQANQGARIDYSGSGIGAYGNDGCSVLTIGGIPDNLSTVKKIAEGSIETKTIYVNADTGSDARDGTSEAKALQTLRRALYFAQYARKAMIYLAAGTYTVPDKTLTLLGRDVRIYGDTAATTILQGNLVCENGFLHLSKVTIDNTDSDTANTSTTAIIAQYNGTVRISDCVVNANSKNAVGVSDISNICCSGTEFKGNAQYAVYVTGQGDAKIYSCTNSTTKGIYSGANSMVRITQSDESNFPYTNANNGMVFVNGQQVLPLSGSIQFRHGKGTFTATATGTNVVWQYGGQQVQGNSCTFDVKSDNALITLGCDTIESFAIQNDVTNKMGLSDLGGKITNTLNLAGCANVTGDLSDLGGKITNTLRLDGCANVTGDLSDLGGKITNTLRLDGCVNVTGDLSDLGGKITNWLRLNGCVNITGDLSDLGGKITNTLNLSGCTNITGDLSDLDGKITDTLSLGNCVNITGSLSDLGGKITNWLNLDGCTNITGDLSDLGGKISRTLSLSNCTDITGVYSGTKYPKTFVVSKTAITPADMDANLINFAASGVKSGKFTATGMKRTAASDNAVATLVANGWTVSGLTKES